MAKLIKRLLSALDSQISWYGSWLWNGFYLFKIALYTLALIDFNLPLNLTLFIALHAHLKKPKLNRLYSILMGVLCLALLYHDSYLPSLKQVLAQKSNLTGFSLSYVIEFITDFINPLQLLALVAAILFIRLASRYIRGSAIVLICFALSSCINSESLIKTFSEDNSIRARQNFLTMDKDLSEHRESFNNVSINRFYEDFLKKERKRSIAFPKELKADQRPFNIVVLSLDNVSNSDLSLFEDNDVSVLKRFNLYLTGFNTATTDFNEAKLRLFESVCGQKERALLLDSKDSRCALSGRLSALGYSVAAFFNSRRDLNTLRSYLTAHTDFSALINPNTDLGKAMYRGADQLEIYNDEDIFRGYLKFAHSRTHHIFAYIHSASLLNGNAFRGREVSYRDRLTTLLDKIDRFIVALDNSEKPTLLVMLPTAGAALKSDRTQLKGMRNIPSDSLTTGSIMVRFCGMKYPPVTVASDAPVSYQAIAYIISKALSDNIYKEDIPLSLEAFTEDIPLTTPVSENEHSIFIKYLSRFFYKNKDEDTGWSEYIR